jgi:putative ABC transport system substrate-binding protein
MIGRDRMSRRGFVAASVAAFAAPGAAGAQQAKKVYRIALFNPSSPLAEMSAVGNSRHRAFFQKLRRLGYTEGQNLVVDRHSAEGDATRLLALARRTVQLRPDVVVAISNRAVATLKTATSAIPIVSLVADPVGFGFATTLARPGGNITGFTIDTGREFVEKHVEFLKQIVPAASRIGFLMPRGVWEGRIGSFYREAAGAVGIAAVGALVDSPADEKEYRRAITAAVLDRVDALYVMAAPENFYRRRVIAALAAETKLPAIYVTREQVEVGGLMAYSIDVVDIYRGLAGYADRILKGANPAEMPFQQPTKFELLINLKTAKALGLTIPEAILARADEIIE